MATNVDEVDPDTPAPTEPAVIETPEPVTEDLPAEESDVQKEEATNEESNPNGLNEDQETNQDEFPPDDLICETDPNFSAICSFFLKFGQSLGISYSIHDLKLMLEDKSHGEYTHDK